MDLLDLEEALKRLERVLPQHARLVEYRYFGGLTVEEAAMLMQISTTTAKRNWAFAKAWLYRELTGGARAGRAEQSALKSMADLNELEVLFGRLVELMPRRGRQR
ncbi:MAG: hypothetical protein K7J46_22040 [Bryobacter sp.]|nr:hypothetical protein [Bryobacter sp. CoA8 C33]